MDKWRIEHLGEFVEDKTIRFGIRYHYLTELYDRSISDLRSPYTGDALPRSGFSHDLMTQNANRIKQAIYEDAEKQDITREQVNDAIGRAAKYSFEFLERNYKSSSST